MISQKIKIAVLLFFLSFSMQSIAQKKKDASKLNDTERMAFDRKFFDANREKLIQNNDKALQLFLECVNMDPSNANAKYEAAKLLNERKKYTNALPLALEATKLEKENVWYLQLLAEVYINTGDTKSAIKVYEDLSKKYPENLEYYQLLANAMLMNNQPQEALKVYNKLEQQIGIDPDLTREKERIYLKMGDIDGAVKEVQKLIDAQPNIQNYAMLVELYQANGLNDKALDPINKMKQIDPNSSYVAFAMAEYYRSKGEKERSFEELKKAFAAQDAPSEVKMQVLSSYLPLVRASEELRIQATELARILTESDPEFIQGHIVYGDFLYQSQKYKEALDQYKYGVTADKNNFILWAQLLDCQLKLSEFASLEKDSKEAMDLFPSQPVIFLYNGIANMQLKKYEDAAKVLVTGSKMVLDNEPLLNNFYSSLGECYHYTKNYPESDKYFDKSLKIDPKNTVTLNNYAYYLSLRNENLEKAESMSKQSNELSPDNSTYEDTYGWVLFQLKKYNDAKEWLERALKNGGDRSGTIVEHYGDVLFKMNKVDEAVEQWKRAKELGDASDQIDKKISSKKLFN